jgi:DNA-binding NarL/FixJ family response regulator
MPRRETALAVSVPSASGEASQERRLQQIEEPRRSDQAERVREKFPIWMALIDPKPLTRRLIGDLLAKEFPEYAMVAASTCQELLEIEEGQIETPTLVIVYIRSAGLTNTCVQSALELLRVRVPEALAVVLSDRDDVDEVKCALTHGARGYIPTSVGCEVVVAALRLVSAGGTFVPANAFRSTAPKLDDQPEGERKGRPDGLDLTPRELSVIDLLREGKPNKLIARQLDMQENTVKVHVRNILKKLNAANRTHAAFVANRLLRKNAEALPNSLRTIDQAQSPGTPKAVGCGGSGFLDSPIS